MIQIQALQKYYQERLVLDIKEFKLEKQESCLILGKSGSGKTTFLHILAGLEQYQVGKVVVLGQDLQKISASAMDKFRAMHIGLIFQKPYFVPTLNVIDNLLLAQYAAGVRQNFAHCQGILAQLNIAQHAKKYPTQLSQGEAQRLTVARAIINTPKLILADEPTASLDDDNAQNVVNLLKEQAAVCEAMLIVVTHDQRIKDTLDKHWHLPIKQNI